MHICARSLKSMKFNRDPLCKIVKCKNEHYVLRKNCLKLYSIHIWQTALNCTLNIKHISRLRQFGLCTFPPTAHSVSLGIFQMYCYINVYWYINGIVPAKRPQWTEKAITAYNTNHYLEVEEIHLFIVHLKDSFIVTF